MMEGRKWELTERERKFLEGLIDGYLENLTDKFADGKVGLEDLIEDLLTVIGLLRKLNLGSEETLQRLYYLMETAVKEAEKIIKKES